MMISRSARLSSAALLFAFATATSASGQITLDVKNALTIGALSSSEAGLQSKPGWSLEASLGYGLNPSLKVFGGYARTIFGCDGGFCSGIDVKISGNHGMLGLEFNKGAPFARAALMYGKTGVTGADAADAGLGFRIGAGGSFGDSVRIRPGISFSWMDASTADLSASATAFSLELGVLIPLG
jgi:hypothetical protein